MLWEKTEGRGSKIRTLLNAILLGAAVRLGVGDALDALVEVVLGRGALLGIPALCCVEIKKTQLASLVIDGQVSSATRSRERLISGNGTRSRHPGEHPFHLPAVVSTRPK